MPPNPWFTVGPASSFPDITTSGSTSLHTPHPCTDNENNTIAHIPGCKVFLAPSAIDNEESTIQTLTQLPDDPKAHLNATLRKGEQVLVFKYKNKFHAMDNKCPHSSFPLSNGTPFDIEDFGVVLSAGIACPKHGWEFDLFTGRADRGGYVLRLWEVEVRGGDGGEEEVWVRRREVG